MKFAMVTKLEKTNKFFEIEKLEIFSKSSEFAKMNAEFTKKLL